MCLALNGLCRSDLAAADEAVQVQAKPVSAKETTLRHIRSFYQIKTPRLEDLEKLIDNVRNDPATAEARPEIMEAICQVLASVNFNDLKQYELAYKYAVDTLRSYPSMTAEMRTGLTTSMMPYAIHKLRDAKDKNWLEIREEMARAGLMSAQSLSTSIDWKFDFDARENRSFLNISPDYRLAAKDSPPQMLFVGMAADSIVDKNVRDDYLAKIQRNREVSQRVLRQQQLRLIYGRYIPLLKQYCIDAYFNEPLESQELQGYLDQYLKDSEVSNKIKSEILDELSAKRKDG